MRSNPGDDTPSQQVTKNQLAMQTAQLRSIAMLAPVMIVSNLVMMAFVQWLYWGEGDTIIKLVWSLSLGFVLLCYSIAWWLIGKKRKAHGLRKQPPTIDKRAVYSFYALAILHGMVWGLSAVCFSSMGPASLALPLAVSYSIMLVFGSAWLAPLPWATLYFVVPVLGGGVATLAGQPLTKTTISMFIILAGLSVATPVIARAYTRLLGTFFKSLDKLKNQRQAVALRLQELEENSSDWVWETDAQGYLVRFPTSMVPPGICPTTMRLLDYLKRIAKEHGKQLVQLDRALTGQVEFKDLMLCLQNEGADCWIKLSGHPIQNKQGETTGFLGTGSDVTLEKLAEDRIAALSQYDSLTGLMNRDVFSKQLQASITKLESKGTPFAVLYLDLDKFKLINDTNGHLFGDRLLAEASERISEQVRETDCVARLGGDEFAILVGGKVSQETVSRLASRLIKEVGKPYLVEGQVLKVGVSIGVAFAPLNGRRSDQLLRNADVALYRAKAEGRGKYVFFEDSMDAERQLKRTLESELRSAIMNDEMVLHYQPLIDAQTGKIKGLEALIRWQHPRLGLLPPSDFIPLAESSNLICDIGAWTLQKACATAVMWPQDLFVAINISAHHFMAPEFLEEVNSALLISGLAPSRLELEITESLLIDNTAQVISKLEDIKGLGVTIAMDDFGTGYSSLSYLMSVPFDKLKIDKSFVDQICVDKTGRNIVRMISKLARELDLNITAEGVENEAQAGFLRSVKCDTLQGFHFSKPIPAEDLSSFFLKTAKKKTQPAKTLAQAS